jgi:hypothetical protein
MYAVLFSSAAAAANSPAHLRVRHGIQLLLVVVEAIHGRYCCCPAQAPLLAELADALRHLLR